MLQQIIQKLLPTKQNSKIKIFSFQTLYKVTNVTPLLSPRTTRRQPQHRNHFIQMRSQTAGLALKRILTNVTVQGKIWIFSDQRLRCLV